MLELAATKDLFLLCVRLSKLSVIQLAVFIQRADVTIHKQVFVAIAFVTVISFDIEMRLTVIFYSIDPVAYSSPACCCEQKKLCLLSQL